MAADDFTPPIAPSISSSKKVSYRVKNAGFGDGYVQRAQEGLHAKTVSWDLIWRAVRPTDGDTIEAFFDSKGGWKSFLYTVPGDIQRRYITGDSFNRPQAYSKADSISVTLTEVHDP